MKIPYIVFLLSLITLISCNKDPQDPVDDATFLTVKASSQEYHALKSGNSENKSDPFHILDMEIIDDSVHVTVSYSGGCKQHSFEIIWSESFSETVPPGTGIIINHDANGDACKALVTQNLVFSLSQFSQSVKFDTVCINVLNGWAPSDSISVGGWTSDITDPYDVVFPQGTVCQIEVTATRVICGTGLYENIWFALNDSVSAGAPGFYFKKYLQPVTISQDLAGFVPVQGKKYIVGATIEKNNPYAHVITCMAYSGPSVMVRINCIKEKE